MIEELACKIPVVSVSGGKDSTACYLWAIEQYGATGFHAVCADTGNEHPVTLNYVRNMHEFAHGPVVEIVVNDFSQVLERKNKPISGIPFEDMVIVKGRVPSARAQFCTELLKLFPIRKWADSKFGEGNYFMITGIRKGESLRRSQMAEYEFLSYYQCWTRRPILEWSESQVFEYLQKHDVEANPLYGLGFTRVGCFPCIHARKSELRLLPDWAWKKIENWENKVGRSWFSAGTVPGASSRFGEGVPDVHQAREWSKTTHGGKQFDILLEDEKDAPLCMSTWGACE